MTRILFVALWALYVSSMALFGGQAENKMPDDAMITKMKMAITKQNKQNKGNKL